MPGISLKTRPQSVCNPLLVVLVARAQVARASPAPNHQNAHREKTRENFANSIDEIANFSRHAFDKILPDKEDRLDGAHVPGIIFEPEVVMFEIVLQ